MEEAARKNTIMKNENEKLKVSAGFRAAQASASVWEAWRQSSAF